MTENILAIENVSLLRSKRLTLNIDRLYVDRGEKLAVIGANGAGKSTLLQLINRHLDYQTGILKLFGEESNNCNRNRLVRRSAMVFQESLLLDDTVFANIALPLKFRSWEKNEKVKRVNEVMHEFKCGHLAKRQAKNLSGGEAQRVCLARAMVYKPELLLLDEPFTSLDFFTRTTLLADLKHAASVNNTTVIFVSHHFSDVLYFAERVIVLQDGCIVQNDRPENILRRPANKMVAMLVEMDNILPCKVESQKNKKRLQFINGESFLWDKEHEQGIATCCIPGDAISISTDDVKQANQEDCEMNGIVSHVVPGIGTYRIVVNCNGMIVNVSMPRKQFLSELKVGRMVKLVFDKTEMQII